MPVHVRFRLNKLTGEVEEFLVDDQDRNLSEAEHDRIAAEVARVVTRNPMIREVPPNSNVPSTSRTEQDSAKGDTEPPEPERRKRL